jgi:hypothetical protein
MVERVKRKYDHPGQPTKYNAEIMPKTGLITTGADVATTSLTATGHPSPAAERMRLHRNRRREGLRCVTVELRETEIDALVRRGLLKAETHNDMYAVRRALYQFLDQTLGATW